MLKQVMLKKEKCANSYEQHSAVHLGVGRNWN